MMKNEQINKKDKKSVSEWLNTTIDNLKTENVIENLKKYNQTRTLKKQRQEIQEKQFIRSSH